MIEIPTLGYHGLEIIGDNIAVSEYKSALPVADVSEPIHFTNRCRYISEVKTFHMVKGHISPSTKLRYGQSISMVKNIIG